MVFVIQNTQNRDSTAMHIKLDELLRAPQGARNQLIDLERPSWRLEIRNGPRRGVTLYRLFFTAATFVAGLDNA